MPNVIIIMADDMGYECLGVNGSTEYNTPVLDDLAKRGMRFTRFHAQPLCTPSRVKLMTGKYNFRNYENFGFLSPDQYTFGQLMKSAGYTTCVVGKWQLSGLYHGDTDSKNHLNPFKFGFDEFCLWQVTKRAFDGERYANPLIEQNGEILAQDKNAYGPDIFSDYALDFINRNKNNPFFLYYPMVLVHDPFVPTPDSKTWTMNDERYVQDTSHFSDMVSYADKIVGKITRHIDQLGISENTIVMFLGDNGTSVRIWSSTQDGMVQGAKGTTLNTATHVPFIISWPSVITAGSVNDDLLGIQDIFPTLSEISGQKSMVDGISLMPILRNERYDARNSLLIYYNPHHSENVNKNRNVYAQTKEYKLYKDGSFYSIRKDPLEKQLLKSLTVSEMTILRDLMSELKTAPAID
ncbi:MAG: sulfatase-like hydrolase/transferase [Saprospiraceae bacterium]|nr:sulfatase-like hydrolase/transferase [Saprospiraceae bacterium]